MKISVNWMQHYAEGVKIMPAGGITELVEKIGAQLGAVEEVIDLGAKYQGIIVAKVVSCEDHPDADKLHVCKIDDGGKAKDVERDDKGLVQVVCGAPNVREGLLVAWLPPGATVPSSVDSDPFVLGSRALRGVMSNGMLASAAELALSDDHKGILEIDEAAKPGDDFAKVYKLDDYIIDIENKMFTHRPDCFGQLGVAREIAGITGQAFKSPKVYLEPQTGHHEEGNLKVDIKNEIPKLVPRFMARVFENVEVKPSPLWLQTYLSRVGAKPINNVVDLTNYFMLQTGQPLHAYDYDKVKALSKDGASIVVRHPKKGEKIKLLNGKEIEPRAEAIMIATDKVLIGVGGVMGGTETEVDENTKNIILECANFDMYSIRRTSMEHGLFTDAVTRFNKGQSALQCDRVLAWIQKDLVDMAHGAPGSSYDVKGKLAAPAPVVVTADFINARLGLKLKAKEMATLLENVEFEAYVTGDELTVGIPFWRTDIEIKEDIVEEVGRLYGFDKLPIELPQRTIMPTSRNPVYDTKAKIRDVLSRSGANEVLTYSFVHGDLLDKVGQPREQAYELSNALSPDLQYFRMSLMPSLLDKVHPNSKAGFDEFALFEINKSHTKMHVVKGEDVPLELPTVALVYSASDKADHPAGAAYYEASKYLTELLTAFGIRAAFAPLPDGQDYPITQPYSQARTAYVTDANSGTFLGIIGEFKASVTRNLKLPQYTAGFELGLEDIMTAAQTQRPYVSLPRFPSVQQDITLKVAAKHSYQEVLDCILEELSKVKPEHTFPRIVPVAIYQAEKSDSKNISFRLKIAAYDRTLKTEEVNSLLDQLAKAAGKKFGAERV